MNREEYSEKMKKQIDDWNNKISQMEAEMHKAQDSIKGQYTAQIQNLRRQRDEMTARMKEMRSASEAAWKEMSQGFDAAWKAMTDSFDRAWSQFHKDKKE